jgi:hypothetical protein
MPCVAFGSYAGVASLLWNAWQRCRGIGGKLAMESVASLAWNQWQVSYGISGNFRAEYALFMPFSSIIDLLWDSGGHPAVLVPLAVMNATAP